MKEATFDPAKKLKLYFRCNRSGSKVFVFVYSDETPYSFIYEDVELNIYRNAGDKKKLIELTVSFSSNRVTTSITNTQSNINEGEYYWELYRNDLDKTWLTGQAIFHNGEFDGVESDTETITVNENGEDVLITVSSEGVSQAELDAALALKADLELSIGAYSTELTFDVDKDIYQDVTTPTFTLAASGNVNGVGIILRLNTPTSVTFPANFEASSGSATLDATKLNVYMLVFFTNWDGAGTDKVIYTNSLFTAI